MSGDFGEDRPRETSKSLISIKKTFCPAIGGAGAPGPPVYASVQQINEVKQTLAKSVAARQK